MMEFIIHIEKTTGKKLCIHPEWGEDLYLYPGDIRKLRLKDGDMVSEEYYEKIRNLYVIPRAKKRALGILSKKDCTRKQMEEKLQKSYYDDKSIEDAIAFLEKLGYIDDFSYTKEYIYYKRKKKSLRQIQYDLRNKGIPSEIINRVMEEDGSQREEELKPLFEKYSGKFSKEDPKSKQKIYMHFARKGYERDLITSLLEKWLSE